MKKALSFILAVIMLCTLIPTAAMAYEQSSEYHEIISKACTIYPEYAEKIEHQEINASGYGRAVHKSELVVNETRKVSEDEYITYSEYSDGAILLLDIHGVFDITQNSSDTCSSIRNYDVNIQAALTNVVGYFKISNFKYSLVTNQYDNIISYGSTSKSGSCTSYFLQNQKSTENAAGDANLKYQVVFRIGEGSSDYIDTDLDINVGHNRLSVTNNRR